jgi:hypothetical protein
MRSRRLERVGSATKVPSKIPIAATGSPLRSASSTAPLGAVRPDRDLGEWWHGRHREAPRRIELRRASSGDGTRVRTVDLPLCLRPRAPVSSSIAAPSTPPEISG